MTLREQFILSSLDKCKHFNGVQHDKCDAGIPYPKADKDMALPCLPTMANGRPMAACERYTVVTQQEAEAIADQRIESMNRTAVARAGAKDHAKTAGLGKGRGGNGSLPCPVGCGGMLHYSVAAYNGHMHAFCTTKGCVSFME